MQHGVGMQWFVLESPAKPSQSKPLMNLEGSDAGGCGHMKTVRGGGEIPGTSDSIARNSRV